MARVECPKCAGRMEEGFVLDTTYGGYVTPTWIDGTPERSRWTGVKLKGRRKVPIVTTRCIRCGFLESYATGDG